MNKNMETRQIFFLSLKFIFDLEGVEKKKKGEREGEFLKNIK